MERKVIRLSKRRTLIWLIIIIVLVIVAGFSYDGMKPQYFGNKGSEVNIPQFDSGSSYDNDYGVMAPSSYPYYNNEYTDISDTREFLKVSYSSRIQTRDVPNAIKKVKGAVREYEGRIDNESSSAKSGYVQFVVPKSNFESFRAEIESITHAKLFTESVSSQNLLGQKQSIERRTATATSTLEDLEKERASEIANHNQKVNSFNRQIASVQTQIRNLRAQQEQTDSEDVYTALQAQISQLSAQEASLMRQLENENYSYSSKISRILTEINYSKQNVSYLEKEDTQFENTIETVNGYISVNWISYWDMAVLISPVHPCIILTLLALIVLIVLYRKGYIPKVELI
jgi:hypothetical protein